MLQGLQGLAPLLGGRPTANIGPLDIPPSPPQTSFSAEAPRFERFLTDPSEDGGSLTHEEHTTLGVESSRGSEDHLGCSFGPNEHSVTVQAEHTSWEQHLQSEGQHSAGEAGDPSAEEVEAEDELEQTHAEPHAHAEHHHQQFCPQELQPPQPPPPPPPPAWQYNPPESGRAGLPAGAEDLPWDQGRSLDALRRDRAQQWEEHCQERRRQSALSGYTDGLVMVSSLISEARRLEREAVERRFSKFWEGLDADPREPQHCGSPRVWGACSCYAPASTRKLEIPGGHKALQACLEEIDAKWRRVGRNALREVHADGQPYDTVRRLANMFIFLEGKQLEKFFPENPHLQARIAAQKRIIETISRQSCGRLFLDFQDCRCNG
eukprot:TRINITY_DN1624_c2_g1_i2.p1 TRINITY_DN1624_c2_g1~~TRINITY_DN1624_c2_g1_i2.p1  ORF type:complete len:441 (+),score=109.17 TRINITY_DN1624_c2_g1_i2:190-1323(+)